MEKRTSTETALIPLHILPALLTCSASHDTDFLDGVKELESYVGVVFRDNPLVSPQ